MVECVPNFSEGRDLTKIERIIDAFRAKEQVRLLDYSWDVDHNRTVATIVGEPQAVKKAVIEAVGVAVQTIDLTAHKGQHPRVGAVDVVPLIPLKNMHIEEADELAKEIGRELAEKYNLPIFFYEESATAEHRKNLAAIRKGEFEGLSQKMQLPQWKPDAGPHKPHPTAGATVVGARKPLIAFNVNLNTANFEIADKIAKKIRFTGGGLRYVKAMGIDLKEKGMMQVSMNLTDYTKTSVYQVVEMIRFEAKRYGVTIAGCELVGLIPLQAALDTAAYYLGMEELGADRVINEQ